MQLILEPREAEVLKTVLEGYLPNLREEIYKTENYEWRQSLHEDEAIVKSLLARLEQVAA